MGRRSGPLAVPHADSFCLDFHAIPSRGEPEAREFYYLPTRGKAGTSILTFFAHEPQSRVLCSGNANLTRADQPGELMQFVEFWHGIRGRDPQWLTFDSRRVPYTELARRKRPPDLIHHDPPPRGSHPAAAAGQLGDGLAGRRHR